MDALRAPGYRPIRVEEGDVGIVKALFDGPRGQSDLDGNIGLASLGTCRFEIDSSEDAVLDEHVANLERCSVASRR